MAFDDQFSNLQVVAKRFQVVWFNNDCVIFCKILDKLSLQLVIKSLRDENPIAIGFEESFGTPQKNLIINHHGR